MTIKHLERSATALHRLLTDQQSGLLAYCTQAWLMVQIPVLVITSAVYIAVEYFGVSKDGRFRNVADAAPTFGGAFASIALAPILETALLILLISFIRRYASKRLTIAACGGLVWGCIHGFAAIFWFPGAAWAFFLFSYAYLVRRNVSALQGWIAAAVPHALMNTTGVTLQLIEYSMR